MNRIYSFSSLIVIYQLKLHMISDSERTHFRSRSNIVSDSLNFGPCTFIIFLIVSIGGHRGTTDDSPTTETAACSHINLMLLSNLCRESIQARAFVGQLHLIHQIFNIHLFPIQSLSMFFSCKTTCKNTTIGTLT